MNLEAKELVKLVLRFLGIRIHMLASTQQICLIDNMSKDVMTAKMHNGDEVVLFITDGNDTIYEAFLKHLVSIEAFMHGGIETDTLEFTDMHTNPFFMARNLEEIRIKLDLLST